MQNDQSYRNTNYKCGPVIGVFVFTFMLGWEALSAPISITWTSDLNFGIGAPGEAALIIPPGSSETFANGSFLVTGDPSRAFTITLPASINMQTSGGGGVNARIAVATFQSNPIAGANGLLDLAGRAPVYIGATRAALRVTQIAGAYAGTYTVAVIY